MLLSELGEEKRRGRSGLWMSSSWTGKQGKDICATRGRLNVPSAEHRVYQDVRKCDFENIIQE